ncbi:MAG: alpha-galactosidase [Fibrella sp.]|nr:alpha-galactosidase [Armatimonadota bacterium]
MSSEATEIPVPAGAAIVTALIAAETASALAATQIHAGYVALPDRVHAVTDAGAFALAAGADGETWGGNGVTVRLSHTEDGGLTVRVSAPNEALHRVRLHFGVRLPEGVTLLGDAFERGYGDLEWRGIVPERRFFWYFVSWHLASGSGFGLGVETGAAALAHFTVDQSGYTLTLETQNGGSGVLLGDRELLAATVRGVESPAAANGTSRALTQALCRRLCPNPRLPRFPVYGSNNWYYAYGRSSHEQILRDAELMASLAPVGTENRPFMVIDDGWQVNSGFGSALGGPHTHGNARFPDMPGLARAMRERGTRPGIWIRPLGAAPGTDESCLLNRERAGASESGILDTLDPTLPENVALITEDVRRLTAEWGYELVKHDFTTFDLFGRWGFAMADGYTRPGWHFADRSRTTAEIITGLYRTIREAAGDAVLIGCNTVGHLGAGLFELQRTGDDTSGREWERTRKMGVNTLAFRMAQHNAFFAVDADCVGIMRGEPVPWSLNRQWLDLLARSGTPLFVSADPEAVTGDIRAALVEAFALASVARPVAEPLDWRNTTCPRRWLTYDDSATDGDERVYDWYDPSPHG